MFQLIRFLLGIVWFKKCFRDRFAREFILILKKAHANTLPLNRHYENICTQNFSRNDLRAPIDEATLARMDACKTVHSYDVSYQVMSAHSTLRDHRFYLSVSIHFSGELENGEKVKVDIPHSLVSAVIVWENSEWHLTKFSSVAQ